ncbi:MAG TPA: hypothetical protein VFV07_11910 [Rhizomicrobium sp.]|nr:hypothetical protein [Rhizomicrobium sp.]
MAGFSFDRTFDAPLARAALRASALGLSAGRLLVAGLLIGLLALPAIALGRFWVGFALILISRAAALVGRVNAPELAAKLAAIVFAGLPFAFALADPTRALAAAFALFGFVAFVSVRRVDTIADLVCTVLFAAACAVTSWFSLIAYALGIACFAAAGATLAKDAT